MDLRDTSKCKTVTGRKLQTYNMDQVKYFHIIILKRHTNIKWHDRQKI